MSSLLDIANNFREGKKFVVLKTKDDGKLQIKVFANAKDAREYAGMSVHLIFYVGKMISGNYAENTPPVPTAESLLESETPDFKGKLEFSFTLSSGTQISYSGMVHASYDLHLDDETGKPLLKLRWKQEFGITVTVQRRSGEQPDSKVFVAPNGTSPEWDDLFDYLEETGEGDEFSYKLDDALTEALEEEVLR